MAEQLTHPRVYLVGGKPVVDADDHRQYCATILAIAHATGGSVYRRVRLALVSGAPKSGGPGEAIEYFGDELPLVQAEIAPLNEAIEGMVPGFMAWLAASGFGDDKDFILALLFWARAMKAMGPLDSTERRSIYQDVAPPVRNYANLVKH